jgi:hypothetical protein
MKYFIVLIPDVANSDIGRCPGLLARGSPGQPGHSQEIHFNNRIMPILEGLRCAEASRRARISDLFWR